MTAWYTKLKFGRAKWGIRVVGPAKSGDVFFVRKKSGEIKVEVVSKVLFSDGQTTVCRIRKSGGKPSTRRCPICDSYTCTGARYGRKMCQEVIAK